MDVCFIGHIFLFKWAVLGRISCKVDQTFCCLVKSLATQEQVLDQSCDVVHGSVFKAVKALLFEPRFNPET